MGMGIAEIGPSILGLMILIVLNRAIKMNCILDGQTLQRLKEIAMIVTVIIFLTVTSTLLEGRPGKGIHWILRIVNGFEFSLSPWSSYLFALTQSEKNPKQLEKECGTDCGGKSAGTQQYLERMGIYNHSGQPLHKRSVVFCEPYFESLWICTFCGSQLY